MKPCKRGHTSGRYASGSCIACARASASKWFAENRERGLRQRSANYAENKQKRNAQSKAWAEANKERRRAIVKKSDALRKAARRTWEEENRESLLAKKRDYYDRNKQSIKAKNAAWKRENKNKVNAYNENRRARERGAEGSFCDSDITALLEMQRGKCVYCALPLGSYSIDHIVPLTAGGSNHRENLQLTCKSCNSRKWTKPHEQFVRERTA